MAIPTMTANSNNGSAGSLPGAIHWAGFTVRLNGVSYAVGSGWTSSRFVWWKFAGGSPIIDAGDELPADLTDDDLVLFINKNGTPFRVHSTQLLEGDLLVDGSIGTKALAADAVSAEYLLANDALINGLLEVKNVVAEAVEAAGLKVGTAITIDSENGIVINLADGGQIVFPADGSPSTIKSHLEAYSLAVQDRLSIQGQNNEVSTSSSVTLAAGVSTPKAPPSVSTVWSQLKQDFAPGFEGGLYGVAHASNGTGYSAYGGSLSDVSVRQVDVNGNGVATFNLPYGHVPYGGVAVSSDGATLWVLVQDFMRPAADASTGGRWFIRRYATNGFVFQREVEYLEGSSSGNRPAIGIASTGDIVVSRTLGGGRVRLTRFDGTNTSAMGNVKATTLTTFEVGSPTTGVYYGPADEGGISRWYFTTAGAVWAAADDGARQAAVEFDLASSSGSVRGFTFDWHWGRFVSLDASSRLWIYSSNRADVTRTVTFSWYDSDTAGTGVHETDQSPPRTWVHKKRSLMQVTGATPNDTGLPDDPNAVRHWIDGQRQPDLAAGVYAKAYETVSTGTTTKAAAFPASATSARVFSTATDGTGPLVDIAGDGTWRFGPLSSTRTAGGRWRTTATTIPSNVETVVPLNGQVIGSSGGLTWNASLNRFECTKAGMYLFEGTGSFPDNNSTGRRRTTIRKNGAAVSLTEDNPANNMVQNVVSLMAMVPGDYVDMTMWQNSGADRTLGGGEEARCHLIGTLVGV